MADEDSRGTIPLYGDETLEDLQRNGFRMIQKKHGFRFGLDSVLLAAYAASFYPESADTAGSQAGKNLRIADLGAGCGAVSLLLAARLGSSQLAGIELDPAGVEVFQRNCRLNHLEDRLNVMQGDIRELAQAAGQIVQAYSQTVQVTSQTVQAAGQAAQASGRAAGSFDLVVSNPPYQLPRADHATDAVRHQAREEQSVRLVDVIRLASSLLKPHGRLVLVHRVSRLADVMTGLREYGFEPETMRFVQAFPEKPPAIYLLSAILKGRADSLTVRPPLTIYERPGAYGEEIKAWYGTAQPLDAAEIYAGISDLSNLRTGDAHGQ
jgi:tRNA1Val (adenine37-N6)-methyltransferase